MSGMMGRRDPVLAKFEGQGHKSKFTVTGRKNVVFWMQLIEK